MEYADDIFCLFNSWDKAKSFLICLNSKHPNIRFTFELETYTKRSFLDVLIINKSSTFLTTMLSKLAFAGLYTKWDSLNPQKYKIKLINNLTDRFWKVNSNRTLFNIEIKILKELLMKSGYRSSIIN